MLIINYKSVFTSSQIKHQNPKNKLGVSKLEVKLKALGRLYALYYQTVTLP